MANVCMVTLTVTGNDEDLAEFEQAAASTSVLLDFERHAPLTNNAERVTAWGTKANNEPGDVMLDRAPGVLTYRFDTLWEPPRRWLEMAAATHPELNLALLYGEEGNRLAGRHTYSGGRAAHIEDHKGDDAQLFAENEPELEFMLLDEAS